MTRKSLRAGARYAAALAVLVAVGCGDPETTDKRGYTKAPLEDPGVFIEGEVPGPMDALGDPNLPKPAELQPTIDEANGRGSE